MYNQSLPIILASQSAIRLHLLEQAGINVVAQAAHVDEEAAKEAMRAQLLSPRDQADKLAELKALKISMRTDQYVLGCDQILALGDVAYDKAANIADARARLTELRGKTHFLESAAVIAKDGQAIWRFIGRAKLTMRHFSDEFLEDYLARCGQEVLSSVGCYMLEKQGVQLFSEIKGDYFSILGLPLLEILDFLREHGLLKS